MFCFRLGSRQVSLSVNKSSLSYDCHIFYKSFQKYDLMFQGSWGSDVLTLSVYSYKSTSFPLLKSAGVGAVLLGFLRYLFSWWKAWKDSLTAILWMFERPQNILSTASAFFLFGDLLQHPVVSQWRITEFVLCLWVPLLRSTVQRLRHWEELEFRVQQHLENSLFYRHLPAWCNMISQGQDT